MKKVIFLILALVYGKVTLAQQILTGLQSMDPQRYATFPAALPSTTTDKLPTRVDLSPTMPPVGNQSPQNSCVAWAIAYAAQGYYAKSNFTNWSFITSTGQPNINSLFSPSYVYNQINNNLDKGSNYETALRLMKEQAYLP